MSNPSLPEELARFLREHTGKRQAVTAGNNNCVSGNESESARAKIRTRLAQGIAIRLGSEAASVAQFGAYVDPGPTWYGSMGALDPVDATMFHALALTADTGAEELEALAVSLWPEAGWAAPNLLRLTGEAYAAGPFELPRAIGAHLGFSADKETVFLIDCPRQRGGAIPPEFRVPGTLTEAFGDGEPIDVEMEVCLGLLAIARRLGGAARFVDSGLVITPDPDSAVAMEVYADRLLVPGELFQIASNALSNVVLDDPATDTPVDASELANVDRTIEDFLGLRALAVASMTSQQRHELHRKADEVDAYYLANPGAVDSYAVSGTVEYGATVVITVSRIFAAPDVLRWESWAQGELYCYSLVWMEQGDSTPSNSVIIRKQRIKRLHVAYKIEQLAAAIQAEVGGAIIDADGFLVDCAASITPSGQFKGI